MDKSPNKEMIEFFSQCLGLSGILLLIVGTVLLKLLDIFGIIDITIG